MIYSSSKNNHLKLFNPCEIFWKFINFKIYCTKNISYNRGMFSLRNAYNRVSAHRFSAFVGNGWHFHTWKAKCLKCLNFSCICLYWIFEVPICIFAPPLYFEVFSQPHHHSPPQAQAQVQVCSAFCCFCSLLLDSCIFGRYRRVHNKKPQPAFRNVTVGTFLKAGWVFCTFQESRTVLFLDSGYDFVTFDLRSNFCSQPKP